MSSLGRSAHYGTTPRKINITNEGGQTDFILSVPTYLEDWHEQLCDRQAPAAASQPISRCFSTVAGLAKIERSGIICIVTDETANLSAGDLRKLGMSYRQINDWDAKGVLPNHRDEESAWREFSARDAFVILLCLEIRGRFGVPLESLRYVQNVMLSEEANHLAAAALMMSLGFAVYVITDLKETFMLRSDLDLGDLFKYGFFRATERQGYALIQVNEIVNEVLACLEESVDPLPIQHGWYNSLLQSNAQLAFRSEQEHRIIEAIRNRDYKRVTLTKKGDDDMVLEMEQEFTASDAAKADVNRMLAEQDFQTVKVSRCQGKNVHIKRTVPLKLTRKK